MDTFSVDARETICNQIEVHSLDYIQSFGVLLVVDKNFIIIQISENIKDWLGIEPTQLLNQKINNIPVNHFFSDLMGFLSKKEKSRENDWISNDIANYEVRIKEEELFFILEYIFIPKEENLNNFLTLFNQTFTFTNQLSKLRTFSQTCQAFAERIKNALGFDKVLIYRFLEDLHGEVIAEAKEEGMEAYLGFHFPQSDLPPQVRALYLKNPLRYIQDSHQEPVPIIPAINPITQKPLNLSFCILKGVIPVHREYINNMQIRTSVSYAIKVEEKLWGLISCHHRQPKVLSYRNYVALSHFAYLFSNVCLLNHFNERELINEQLKTISEVISSLTSKDKTLHEAFMENSSAVLRIVDAAGAALHFDGHLTLAGTTPTKKEIEHLIQWLCKNHQDTIFHTDSLSKIIPEARSYKDIASGMIAAPIGSGLPNYIFWFRPEQLTSIHWGGNPQEVDQGPAQSKEIKPRESFRLWKEEILGHSKKWIPSDLETVEQLLKGTTQSFLSVYYLKKMIAEADLLKVQIAADKASEGIIILDQMGKVEWMNSKLIHLLGRNSLNEVLLPLVSLLGTISQSNIESIQRAIKLKEQISLNFSLKDRMILFTLTPFKNFVDQEIKIIGIATDITEINRISKEIETKAEALHLANEHLNKLLKVKDQLIRMAAHDLRNPISSIIMAASILEDTKNSSDFKTFQEIVILISKQSNSMLELLNDILNTNVIESGQFSINNEAVNIENFIKEICEFHKFIASKNHIHIQVENKIDQNICNIDKIKIKQVIDNFLSNAVKFSPPNTIIKVRCLTSPTHLRVEVQDQGAGIPKEEQEKNFEHIPRIIPKTSGEEAHGLGLSICKQIIRAHHGEIGVQSNPGMGATFYFDIGLPLPTPFSSSSTITTNQ